MPESKITPKVIFEDKALLVINKPAGLVVHPAPSHKGTTLVDWVREYLGPKAVEDFEEADRLGLVHRLDKDTSGVIVVTKTPEAKTNVGRQFHDRIIQKQYIAFVQGIPPKKTGIIDAPIGRSLKVATRMAIVGNGRPSETRFEIDETMKEVALVNLYPKTGRTHQLRVHCAAIGHPIVGDKTYGAADRWSRDFGVERPLLHAYQIALEHPTSGKPMSFTAPWPADMKKYLTVFRKAFKAAVLLGLITVSVQAETTPTKKASTTPRRTTSSEGTPSSTKPAASSSQASSTRREMNALKEQFKVLIEEVSALQDKLNAVQTNLDELGGARRLRDIEKAISDLNGKAVSSAAVTEETKTQTLDISRKLKAQEVMLEQLRDQLDRLTRELIQARSRQDEAPAPRATTTQQ